MSNITDKAKEYLSYKLSVIPTKEDKVRVLIETRGEGGYVIAIREQDR